MEDSQVDQIFAGDLENLPPFKQPLIRIYMSSTFTDMALEKSALFSEVYPKLKEYCREHYGLEFQVRDFFLHDDVEKLDLNLLFSHHTSVQKNTEILR